MIGNQIEADQRDGFAVECTVGEVFDARLDLDGVGKRRQGADHCVGNSANGA